MEIVSDEKLIKDATYTFQLTREGYLQLKMAVNNAFAMSGALREFANKHAKQCSAPCYFNSNTKEDFSKKCELYADDFEELVGIFLAMLNESQPVLIKDKS